MSIKEVLLEAMRADLTELNDSWKESIKQHEDKIKELEAMDEELILKEYMAHKPYIRGSYEHVASYKLRQPKDETQKQDS